MLYTVQLALPMFCHKSDGLAARHLEVARILIHDVGAKVEIARHKEVRRHSQVYERHRRCPVGLDDWLAVGDDAGVSRPSVLTAVSPTI